MHIGPSRPLEGPEGEEGGAPAWAWRVAAAEVGKMVELRSLVVAWQFLDAAGGERVKRL